MKKPPITLLAAIALLPLTVFAEPSAPISLFDGKSMDGWKTVNPANARFWSVVDGVITGSNGDQKVPTNTYLVTEKSYGDFEFRCEFRITGEHETGLINSGIQYRSLIKDGKIIGYQADIGRGYWGDIYDEHRRGKLVGGDMAKLQPVLKEDGWNDYLIRCKGNQHELFINGVKVAAYEEKGGVPAEGVIGLQLHSGGIAKVEFKAITVTPL